ncbi:hypothetical protein C0W92_09930 [Photobacterium angustum]|uniref:Uncharacterized protein n=1 Tax=Photobacterium angustum TaxID=661 RepID=A0A855SHV5_PHOAN|nr:hypothetical protein UA69_15380 [Photobacterium angustum]KJG38387.1 hypothetical protein UA35_15440 [Photobacterium angustum]KJG48074.1 hypothetical protein UA30_15380 [Photobacterium angustum]KJG51956.1 hypothetical protein UA34_16255 [Photobacterium angustum]PSW90333.1 hypothetical protein C0W92_09930 [Photobacterium angustum]
MWVLGEIFEKQTLIQINLFLREITIRAMRLMRHKILYKSKFTYTIVNKIIWYLTKKIEKKFLLFC